MGKMEKIEKLERYVQGVFGVQAHKDGNYCMYATARAREDALLEALKSAQSLMADADTSQMPVVEGAHFAAVRWQINVVLEQIEATR